MVDATTRHEALSFMLNQIRMALSDKENDSFQDSKGNILLQLVQVNRDDWLTFEGNVFRRIVGARGREGKERDLYYLNRTLVGAEVNYSPIEKMCLALFFAIDKMRHYMQTFTVHLVAKADPIKYVLSKSIISGHLAKRAVLRQ
ncbi:uncharacterized protein E5676_scaffold1428G00890 [Cucumis melo var. makuwa]|uniref:Reverse transcriptase RNase H-like domain-containing protein n=1 Tax=Cucumis melo var. makuwa TaxID=1194695 RepID=A0A5D3DFJ6_CUCMM|nr:uncharacterized protein E6C27_scaffold142G00220 [Cucumis melo var. makuwa]TYK22366.1 uncharacterized protein E5676_scaffold1428G00890 [Cucumis melo var. makuwa]